MLCLLLAGSSLLAVAPAALGAISIDDVQPQNNAASISNPYLPMNANISGQESSSVAVDSSSEWLDGLLDSNTIVGTGGTLQLRRTDKDDFSGQGTPDTNLWNYNDNANQANGLLTLSTDLGNGIDNPWIRSTQGFDLSQNLGLYLNCSVTPTMLADYGQAWACGWWTSGPLGDAYAGIYMEDDGSATGTLCVNAIAIDPQYGYSEAAPFCFWQMNVGMTIAVQLMVSTTTWDNIEASININAAGWNNIGAVWLNFTDNGAYQAWSGTDYSVWQGDMSMDIDFLELGTTLYASGGVYESAPIATGLYSGAFVNRISFATSDGQMNGITSVRWQSGPDSAGPWTGYSFAPLNTQIDEPADAWIQFEIVLSQSVTPSWPDSITFDLAYKTEVGAFFLDDFADAPGELNGDSWTLSSTATFQDGLDLDSNSADASIGVTYRNDSWLIADTHHVEAVVGARVLGGDSVASGGAGDQGVLLAGFVASDGASPTGYVGVVRLDDGVDTYWGLSWDDGTGPMTYGAHQIMTAGDVLIRIDLEDGNFNAWVLETANPSRGWLSLGGVDWSATAGTAWWRIGDMGFHSGSQHAVVGWAALLMRWMTPGFGALYTAGNLDINEDENTRAVIAFNGPTWDLQRVTYRLDTTAPSGTLSLNAGSPYTRSTQVALHLEADDRYGVPFYAASESLSFPEGWKPFTSDTNFFLSGGDGRKVVWVRFMDSSGVASNPINASLILDTQRPSGAVYIANRSAYSNSLNVDVTFLAFDGEGLRTAYLANNNIDPTIGGTAYDLLPGGSAPPAQSTSRTQPWTLNPGDGTKTVSFLVEDMAGWQSAVYLDDILVDTSPPVLSATLSNSVTRGGTIYVNSSRLTVHVETSDPSGVREVDISEDPLFATYIQYTGPGNLIYDMPAVSGQRSLYVRAFDIYGLQAPDQRIDFFVDITAPTGSIDIIYTGQTELDFNSNTPGCCNSQTLAKARGVVLVVNATDNVGVTEVQFSSSLYFPGSPWRLFTAGRYYFELSANDGLAKTVYVRFRDINGNPSQAFVDEIDMDTTPPGGTIIVNSGDATTIDPLLSLSLEATDNFEGDLQMRLALTPDFGNSTWLPFSDSARFDARTTAGEVTVYYQVRDANGWESLTYSDSITVRPATCQELNNCSPIGSPGFDGAYAAFALAAVAAVGLLGRRRRML